LVTLLPRIVIHNEVSLDGRMDWFTPDIGQFYQLAGHWHTDAILTGSETILSAPGQESDTEEKEPGTTEVGEDESLPLLIVPDSRGRIRNWDFWRRQPYWRDVIVFCSRATPPSYLEYLQKVRIQFITAGDEHVDLRQALMELSGRWAVELVRVDSGGMLNGVLLRAGLVDEVSVLIDPCLVGGMTPRSLFRAPDLTEAEGVILLRLIHYEKVRGDVIWVRYEVLKE
jgi:2,5-diamino-6-(ribosylamino)-4(3H)-pyrimidinone 5'-phosphate reductase